MLLVHFELAREPVWQIKSMACRYNKKENKGTRPITIKCMNPQHTVKPVSNGTNIFFCASTCHHVKWHQVNSNSKWPQMEHMLAFLEGGPSLSERLFNVMLHWTIQLMFYFNNCKPWFTSAVPISHGAECLWGASGGKLTLNLLISRQFLTHDLLTLSALNELRGWAVPKRI